MNFPQPPAIKISIPLYSMLFCTVNTDHLLLLLLLKTVNEVSIHLYLELQQRQIHVHWIFCSYLFYLWCYTIIFYSFPTGWGGNLSEAWALKYVGIDFLAWTYHCFPLKVTRHTRCCWARCQWTCSHEAKNIILRVIKRSKTKTTIRYWKWSYGKKS